MDKIGNPTQISASLTMGKKAPVSPNCPAVPSEDKRSERATTAITSLDKISPTTLIASKAKPKAARRLGTKNNGFTALLTPAKGSKVDARGTPNLRTEKKTSSTIPNSADEVELIDVSSTFDVLEHLSGQVAAKAAVVSDAELVRFLVDTLESFQSKLDSTSAELESLKLYKSAVANELGRNAADSERKQSELTATLNENAELKLKLQEVKSKSIDELNLLMDHLDVGRKAREGEVGPDINQVMIDQVRNDLAFYVEQVARMKAAEGKHHALLNLRDSTIEQLQNDIAQVRSAYEDAIIHTRILEEKIGGMIQVANEEITRISDHTERLNNRIFALEAKGASDLQNLKARHDREKRALALNLKNANDRLETTMSLLLGLDEKFEKAKNEAAEVYLSSTSWRITKPLRSVMNIVLNRKNN